MALSQSGLGQTMDALPWRRSSFCHSGECIEVAVYDGMVLMRDSKEPHVRPLRFSAEEFEAFVRGAAAGDFASIVNC
jgi:uncharacterized protein DUF397